MPLGNSITEGWDWPPLDPEDRIAYRLELESRLSLAAYDFDFVGHNEGGSSVLTDDDHAGISGLTDGQMLRLLQDGYDGKNDVETTGGQPYLDVFPTDVILLHIGTNDILETQGDNADTIGLILDEIDAWEISSGNEVQVFVAQIINMVPYDPTITSFNTNIASLVAGRADPGITLVDMENMSHMLPAEQLDYGTDMRADGIHPTATGDAKIGAAWFSPLSSYLTSLIPAAPSGLSASAVDESTIDLSWTDNSSVETGFSIERSTSSGSGFSEIGTAAANATTYSDVTAAEGQTYYYRVLASGLPGSSAYSSEASETALPSAPTGLSASALNETTIRLTWSDNSSRESGYLVERSTTSGSGFSQIASLGANISTYDDAGRTPGTTYYYQVRAAGNGDPSDYSNESSAATGLPAPSGLSATAISSSTINLGWTDNSGSETGFSIERSTSSGSGFSQIGTASANATSYSDATAAEGQTYYYQVRATGASSSSGYSNEASATAWPATPGGLSASALNETTIRLTWSDNSSRESGYLVERSTTSGSGFSQIASLGAGVSSYDDAGRTPGTTYYYQVRAAGAGDPSAYSNEASVTTAPAAPSGLAATAAGSSTINLGWTDNSSTETGFSIERSLSSGAGFSPIGSASANATSYSDATTAEGQTYFYRIRATGSTGSSTYSNEATTSAWPAAPGGLSASALSENTIRLTWSDNSSRESGYLVERSTTSGSGFSQIASLGAGVTGYDDAGRTPGTTYYYQVRAAGAGDPSAYSNEASAATSLNAPTLLSATAASASTIDLSWTDNSGSETGFSIERSTTSGSGFSQIGTASANAGSYSDASATEGTTYYYRVRATGAGSPSAYSNESSATSFLATPTLLSASTVDASNIALSWNDNSSRETGYRVERSSSEFSGYATIATLGIGVEAYNDAGVSEGSTYFYRVMALGSTVNSAYSNVSSATTSQGTPSGLSATAQSSSSIQLNWTDNTSGENGFSIERSTTSGSGFSQIATTGPNSSAYLDTGLDDGDEFFYRVRAYKGADFSDYSNEASAITPLATPDGLLISNVTSNGMQLDWNDNTDNESSYRVERSLVSGSGFSEVANLPAGTSSYTDSPLSDGTRYYYRVRATSALTSSAYSAELSGITLLAAPASLSASSIDSVTIELSWLDQSSAETGFRIQRALTSGGPFSFLADVAANQLSYTDGGVNDGTRYYYRIQALGLPAASDFSNEASATTPMSSPTSLTATALDDSRIQLNWNDNSASEVQYSLQRSLNPGSGFAALTLLPSNSTSYLDTGLDDGIRYYYRVRAIGSYANSQYSNVAGDTTFLLAPTTLAATAIDSATIDLSWTDNSSSETGFLLERSLSSGSGFVSQATLAANQISYTDAGVVDGTQYYYRISAIGPNGNSSASNEANAITPLSAPGSLSATAVDESSIQLNWLDQSGNESGYRLERSLSGGSGFSTVASLGAGSNSYLDSGLDDDTEYFYRVMATGFYANSTYSNVASDTTALALPANPSDFTATATNVCEVYLEWKDLSDNEEGFELERSLQPITGFSLIQTLPADALSFTDTGTVNNTTYYYRIRAFNEAGYSAYQSSSEFVNFVLDGGTIAADQTICPTGDPLPLTSIASATGGSNNWNYQWQSRVLPAAFANIEGATSTGYDPPEGLMESTEYIRVASLECGTASSNVLTITVEDNQAPVFTSCPADQDWAIARNKRDTLILTPDPVYFDNCDVSLLTWTMSGDTVAASPDTGINLLGAIRFPLGTTVVNYHAEDYFGNGADCQYSVTVDIRGPEIRQVSIPDGVMKIGDLISATIKVANDGDTEFTLITGTVGGYPLTDLVRINETTYLANFEVVEGGNSYAAEEDIPVENLVLSDGSRSNAPYQALIVQSNDLLDASYPVVVSLLGVPGAYKIGDALVLNITTDGEGYTLLESSRVNGIALSDPRLTFAEIGAGLYRLTYTIMEGDTDVPPGLLTLNLVFVKPSGNVGAPHTLVDNVDELSIDAHAPVITRMEVPSSEVGIGGTVQVSIVADQEKYSVAPGTVVNGIPLSSGSISFEEVGSGFYILNYIVQTGDAAVEPGELKMSLVLSDSVGNVNLAYEVLEVNQLEIYTDLPNAILAGTPEICEDETAELLVFLNGGRNPWFIDVSDGKDTTTYSNITSSEFDIDVFPQQTTTYRVVEIRDKNGVVNSGSGSFKVNVNPKTEVSFVNLKTNYSLESAPAKLEANVPGGTFSGPGVNTSSGMFYPAIAGIENSPHTLVYTYENPNGCTSLADTLVFVLGAEGDIFIPYGVVCDDADPFKVQGSNVADDQGSFRLLNQADQQVAGLEDHGDNTATINPALLSAGVYTIEYTYFDEVTFHVRENFVLEEVAAPLITAPTQSAFCQNEDSVLLEASVFGAVFSGNAVSGNLADGYYFHPDRASIDVVNTITCTLTSENGCSKSSSKEIRVLFAPDINFSLNEACVSNEGGEIQFSNLTAGKVLVETWEWNFGDPASGDLNTSSLIEPSHFYEHTGEVSISLMATTIEGCSDTQVMDTVIGVLPLARFNWISDCYDDGQKTLFLNKSDEGSAALDSVHWSFYTSGGSLLGENGDLGPADTASFQFSGADSYLVSLYVRNEDACSRSTSQEISLRPSIILDGDTYLEDFNGDVGAWTSSADSSLNSWAWDMPDFDGYTSTVSDKAWYTDLPEGIAYLEHSWVQSPCFDFSAVEAPMISLDIMRSFVPRNNGAVLQYRTVIDEGWKRVGDVNTGLAWYSSGQITNLPGGGLTGWGLDVFNPDTTWVAVAHDLDEVKGMSNVSFRLAVATTGEQGIGNQGFAFDNFLLRERNKRVVLEHFTNSSHSLARTADDFVDALSQEFGDRLVNLQYHTSSPGLDPMNENNPVPPDNRSFQYGIPEIPYSILDGGTMDEHRFDFDAISSEELERQLRIASLEEALFEVSLEVDWKDEELVAIASVSSLAAYNENVQLYVAVLETEVTAYTGTNGDQLFRNVVLDMLPTSGGTLLGDNWFEGKTEVRSSAWSFASYVEDVNDLAVVALIQDRSSGKILQSSQLKVSPNSAVPSRTYTLNDLHCYPNPVQHEFFVNLGDFSSRDGQLELISLSGKVVRIMEVPAGHGVVRMGADDLQPGIYMLRYSQAGSLKAIGKLVKAR